MRPIVAKSAARVAAGKAAHVVALAALVAGLLAVSPAAQARVTANPVLRVNYFTNGSIAVTLPDGTPVGTPSGAPTVIPAGYYTVTLFGPGGCANVPIFELKGPGTSIVDNMDGGELSQNNYNAYFAPNATFTWKDDDTNPPVTFSFATSGVVLGSPPAVAGATGNVAGDHGTAQSTNPLGQDAPIAKLTGAVSASGGLTLALKGKLVKSLAAGKYSITVTDKSKTNGFMLVKGKSKHSVSLTTAAFVGKHSATVQLTAGRWVFMPTLSAKKTYTLVVA
ncbi:MAG TPA: hypothetical protein VGM80_13930 [Gaiellaceae bacterium]